MDYVGLAIPWVAFGNHKLWSDSGFLTLFDVLSTNHKNFGCKSLMYLDHDLKEQFESINKPEETGVYPVYSAEHLTRSLSMAQNLDESFLNKVFDGQITFDYVITNKYPIVPGLVAQLTMGKPFCVPVFYIALNVGKDNVKHPEKLAEYSSETLYVSEHANFHVFQEALAYVATTHVFWTTEDQRRRGMLLAKRFLSGAEIQRLSKRYSIIGNGIPDVLQNHMKPDETIKKELQSSKEKFRVSFLGRVTSNKNLSFIADTMLPLFAHEDIKLEIKPLGEKSISPKKYFAPNDAPSNIIDSSRFSGAYIPREEYFSKVIPETQCLFYASNAEGYCAVPRELACVGVPVLLPRVPWATTGFGPNYPFYYSNQAEAHAIVLRLKTGNISDDEVERFLEVRRNGYTCEFMSSVAGKMYKEFIRLSDAWHENINERIASQKATQAFEEVTDISEEFTLDDLIKRMLKAGVNFGTKIGFRVHNRYEIVSMLRSRFAILNPATGLVKRLA